MVAGAGCTARARLPDAPRQAQAACMPGLPDTLASDLVGLAAALGIGLLIGIERERVKGAGMERAAAGVRTFALLALAGALAQLVGPVGIGVGGAFVALAVLASYRRTRTRDPGLTTEVAMLAAFLLGIVAMRVAVLAVAAGVVVAVLLASKGPLHRFTREKLTPQELHDGLLLMAAAFVVLPLLPDRTVDPWQVLNPRRLWFLVIALMTVSTAGYLALRLFGSRLGLALAGLAGGFVSSTATIAAMGDRARQSPELAPALASAALLSNVATVVQLAVVIGALAPPLLGPATVPLATAGIAAVVVATISGWRGFAAPADVPDLAGKRPFELRHVLAFAAILGGIMVLAAIARHFLGDRSLPWVLAASGLADVHAGAASAAQLVAAGQIGTDLALVSIAAAFVANSASKCAVALLKGGRAYAWRVIPGIVVLSATFVVAVLLPTR